MQDFDKWPPAVQWAIGLGAFFGGLLMAWFGARAARTKPADEELERVRGLGAIRQEVHLAVTDAKSANADALSATRKSFYDEFEKLETRLRVLENDNAAHKAEIRELQRRRTPRQ